MAKYNCSSFDQYANLLKKDIKAAMRGKIRIPADVEECECGFREIEGSKEECEKIILDSVDEIVYHLYYDGAQSELTRNVKGELLRLLFADVNLGKVTRPLEIALSFTHPY